MGIFAKLADIGLSSCRTVVGADARKWGHFGGYMCEARCALVGSAACAPVVDDIAEIDDPVRVLTRASQGGMAFVLAGEMPNSLQ